MDEVFGGEWVSEDVEGWRWGGERGEGGVGVEGVADLIHSSVFGILKLSFFVECVWQSSALCLL